MSEALYLPAARAAELDLLALSRRAPIHFMGVCGAGMSALAEYVVRAGGMATGCDARLAPAAGRLRELGVALEEGHGASHAADAGAVVVTSAVPARHPELEAARERGVPVLKRAAALGALVNAGRVVAVAGTHGKTTTSGMLGTTLAEAGLDPTAFVGGRVPGWRGGLRAGSPLFIVEADEYDRSFLALRPDLAVVTTLEPDHMEIYGDLESLYDAFVEFLDPVPGDGLVAVCADDPGAAALAVRVAGRPGLVTYGTDADARLRAERIRTTGEATEFHLTMDGAGLGDFRLAVPGRHNVRNALATLAVCLHLDAPMDGVRRGLESFPGVERRFQRLGEFGGVTVVNDYAHHPTEVAATMDAARERFPDRRLVAVFQPHLYTRTRDLWQDFGTALMAADAVWVTDVYPAREAPIEGVSGRLVADAVAAAGGDVVYRAAIAGIDAALADVLEPGDVCVLMGAGDIDEHGQALARRLGGEAS